MFYLGVNEPEIAISRIAHRVEIGGHAITEELVRQRFATSLANLREALELCDEVYLIDNTVMFRLVRSHKNGIINSSIRCPEVTWIPKGSAEVLLVCHIVATPRRSLASLPQASRGPRHQFASNLFG